MCWYCIGFNTQIHWLFNLCSLRVHDTEWYVIKVSGCNKTGIITVAWEVCVAIFMATCVSGVNVDDIVWNFEFSEQLQKDELTVSMFTC